MQEKLIIYLHADDLSQPGWAVMDENGQVRQSVYRDNADDLAQLANQKDIIVIVPAEDVLLTETKLPKMSRSRLIETIPFAIEEQLIDDVENLHFAISESSIDGSVSVAIVARNKMQQWQALLQAWNIHANAMLPACLALAFAQDTWHIAISENGIVRIGAVAGFACEKANLATYLNLALANMPSLPQQIIIHNYTAQTMLPLLNVSVIVKEEFGSPEQMLEDMARQAGNHLPLDLLQGSFSIKKTRFPKLNNSWKTAVYLAAVFLALLFLYPAGSYIILKKRESDLQQQIAQLYRQHFPQGKSMVAPKIRMEDKLHTLQGAMGENKLLLLLGYVGKGISQASGIQLKRFDFQNGQLTVELNAATSKDFSSLNSFLMQQGLQVKQQNAVLSGERVNATLQIE